MLTFTRASELCITAKDERSVASVVQSGADWSVAKRNFSDPHTHTVHTHIRRYHSSYGGGNAEGWVSVHTLQKERLRYAKRHADGAPCMSAHEGEELAHSDTDAWEWLPT